MPPSPDVLVIGAGFGGLGCALSLAERGAKVLLVEALTYPGGCASSFERKGHRFEAGATLFSGLAPNQLFGRWNERWGLGVEVDWLDPVMEVRAPGLRLQVLRDRAAFVDTLCALPGAPAPALRGFFAAQSALADALWELFDEPELLPPLSSATLWRHLLRAPRLAPVLPFLTRPLTAFLARYGLDGFAPLRAWLDPLCQITVQCPADEAEAAFALAAMDYGWRGTGHVRGGIGRLATGLAEAVGRAGGEVRFAERARGLRREGGVWRVELRTGEVRAPVVVANLLPADLGVLLGGHPALDTRHAEVAAGWGAVMLYRVVEHEGPAHHLDLTAVPGAPLVEGNHVFVSVGGPEQGPRRSLTASTHVALDRVRGPDVAEVVAAAQAKMRTTIAALAPELGAPVLEMTASPRTFQRFTRRREGAVGGAPRRAGWAAWRRLGPEQVGPGLWLVGDSVFPGQSTYAAALGGHRVAEAITRSGRMPVASEGIRGTEERP